MHKETTLLKTAPAKEVKPVTARLHPFDKPCFGRGRRVTILGATGSIGLNTLAALERNAGAEGFEFVALTAHGNADLLIELALKYRPEVVAIGDTAQADKVRDALASTKIEIFAGEAGVLQAAERPADWVCAAIVGAAGLAPTLKAAANGSVIALANKECLVTAGSGFMRTVAGFGATIFPVDSEHNALYHLLAGLSADRVAAIKKYYLTASGGPFLRTPLEELASVTPEQAVMHPNWSMGAKISVDSATMMNKGLEIIEACRLFHIPPDKCGAVIHPQSFAHGALFMRDGSVLTYMSPPDMRIPLQSAVTWPQTGEAFSAPTDDFPFPSALCFEPPNYERFPALRAAEEALRRGDAATAALNAANEVCVRAFLQKELRFDRIACTSYEVMSVIADKYAGESVKEGTEVLAFSLVVDEAARRLTSEKIRRFNG